MEKLSLQYMPMCALLIILANTVCVLSHAMQSKGSKICHGISLVFLSWAVMGGEYSRAGYVTLLVACLVLFHHDGGKKALLLEDTNKSGRKKGLKSHCGTSTKMVQYQ